MISVIIPTYKSPEALELCLQSAIEGQQNKNQIIVVVDGFYEYSAPMSIRQNLHDRKLWAMSNPALGHTISEEAIEESIATNSIEATLTETFSVWIDSQVSPWTFGSIEACSNSELVLPVGAMTVMAFDVSPSKRTGSLVAAQIVDGKIGVGLMETFSSEIAIDELKMTLESNPINYIP